MSKPIRSVPERLSDIVLRGEKLAVYLSGSTPETLANDSMALDAATKCIEVIGEAARHVLQDAPELQERFPALELYAAYQTRNRLSHGYFDVDPERIWGTAHFAVPELVAGVKEILRETEQGAP